MEISRVRDIKYGLFEPRMIKIKEKPVAIIFPQRRRRGRREKRSYHCWRYIARPVVVYYKVRVPEEIDLGAVRTLYEDYNRATRYMYKPGI